MSVGLRWADCPVIETIPGKVSGAWVFKGTRPPVFTVLSNLRDLSIDEMVEEFPTADKAQIEALLILIAVSSAATPDQFGL